MAKKKKALIDLAAWMAKVLPMPLKQALYHLGPVSRLLRGALNSAAPQEETVVTIAGGALQGLSMRLNLQAEKDFWLGTYEPDLQIVLRELVKPGMTAYDVGANIGYISLMLAQAVDAAGKVYCFEALPANVKRLRANLELNPGLCGQMSVVPCAVTDKAGAVRFLVHDSVGMGKVEGSGGRHTQYAQAIEVEGISLDNFVFNEGQPAPDVIKLDIEGGEVLALPGMRRLLAEYHPLMFMELHGPDSASAAWNSLSSLGYRIREMGGKGEVITDQETLGWKAYLIAEYPANRGNQKSDNS